MTDGYPRRYCPVCRAEYWPPDGECIVCGWVPYDDALCECDDDETQQSRAAEIEIHEVTRIKIPGGYE